MNKLRLEDMIINGLLGSLQDCEKDWGTL